MPTYQSSKSRVSKTSSEKSGFKFRWWMGLVLVGVVAVIGIIILNFSHASASISCNDSTNADNGNCQRVSEKDSHLSSGLVTLASLGYGGNQKLLTNGASFYQRVSDIFGPDNGKREVARLKVCWTVVNTLNYPSGVKTRFTTGLPGVTGELENTNSPVTLYAAGTTSNLCGKVLVTEPDSNIDSNIQYSFDTSSGNDDFTSGSVSGVSVNVVVESIQEVGKGNVNQPANSGISGGSTRPSTNSSQPAPPPVGQIVVGKYTLPGAPYPNRPFKGTLHSYLAPANAAPGNTQICIKNKYGQVVACGPGGNINLLIFRDLKVEDGGYTAYIPHENYPAGWALQTAFIGNTEKTPVDYAVSDIQVPANSYAEVSFYFEKQ